MKKNITVSLAFALAAMMLNSCLKDDADYWPDDVSGKMYATVANPNLQTLSLQPVADTVTYEFLVNIATDALPSNDVTIGLAVDPDAVTAYNERKGTSYLAYPSVALITPSVTIKSGTRNAYAKVKVWGADKLNPCDNFIAAVSITTISDDNVKMSANMKSSITALPISNPWAGDYHTVGYRIHPSAGYGGVDATQTLSTVNCNTVKKTGVGNYSAYDAQIEITTDPITVLGKTCYKVNVTVLDPSTGEAVDCGMFSTFTGDNTKPPTPPSSEVNYYNPDTKQFVLNYYYNSAAPRKIYEILTRL